MRLSTFIRQNIERIVDEWQVFAETLLPAAASMSPTALRDHSRPMLEAIAADLDSERNEPQRSDERPEAAQPSPIGETAAATHGALRHDAGFDLSQLTAEFRALRSSVLRLWLSDGPEMNTAETHDMLRFNEAIDRALAESVARYAEELGRSRSMFLAILGHDLRTPLGAIAMTTQLLAIPGLPQQKQSEALARIDRSAAAMNAMIRDLLEFARTRLGKGMPVTTASADLGAICRSALEDVRSAHPSAQIRLEESGDLRAMVDRDRMRQVLWNLLNNAVQYGAGNLPITLEAFGDERRITLEVRNHGLAIPPEALQVIFDPMVQIANPASPAANLGLGLFIAREIVQAHGGSIEATSSAEDGTRFRIVLPRAAAA